MSDAYPPFTGETGTVNTGTNVVTLDDTTGVRDLRLFSAAVTAGSLADGQTVRVLIKESATKQAAWIATYDSTAKTLTRVSEIDAIGTLTNVAAVDVTAEPVDPAHLLQAHLNQESISPTTANVTASVNTRYVADISGLTANRNFVLPTPNAIGDVIELKIKVGDDTYALIPIGDTGVKINNGTAATEAFGAGKGRVFIKDESYRWVATSLDNWDTAIDGRIPQEAMMHNNAAQSVASSTNTLMALNTVDFEVGLTADNTATNYSFTVRRAGRYTGFFKTRVKDVTVDTRCIAFITVNGNTTSDQRLDMELWNMRSSGTFSPILHVSGVFDLSAGDDLSSFGYQDTGSPTDFGMSNWNYNRMAVKELL